jgi:CubicO group peptidase (beta-lactamase class C family)
VTRARSLVAVACAASIGLGAGCGGSFQGASDAQLRVVVDDLTHDVFTGVGLASGTQRFHVPGTALTVIPVGEPLRTYTSGVADIATDEPRLADQVQPVGSNTKVMTATVVMQLVEDGEIGLDQTLPRIAAAHRADRGRLARLVRSFERRVHRVTLRELLNHTSGIADCLDSPAFARAFERNPLRRWTLAELSRIGLAEKPEFSPGAPGKWNYSDTEYMLLGMVVEAVTGDSMRARMEALFDEAGMRDSYYAPSPRALVRPPLSRRIVQGYMPIPPRREQLPAAFRAFDRASVADAVVSHPAAVEAVQVHTPTGGPAVEVSPAPPREARRAGGVDRFRYQNVTTAYSQSIGLSAGGVVSSTEDVARFWLALFSGELVGEETLGQMQETVPTGENEPGVTTRWGLGFGEQIFAPNALYPGSLPGRVWMHLGDIFGYASAAYFVENQGLVVANATNLFPQPVGDLGLLRNVLRAWQAPEG